MLSWSCRDLLVQLWRSYLCFSFSRTELVLSSERFVPRDARSEGRSKLTTRTAASSSKKHSTFHPHAQRSVFRRRDAHRQSRLFVRENPRLRHSPNSNR